MEFVRWLAHEEQRAGALQFPELLLLDAVVQSGKVTAGQAAEFLQTSETAAQTTLEQLTRRGYLRRNGNAAHRTYLPAPGPLAELAPGREIPPERSTALEARILEAARHGVALTRREVAATLGLSSDQAKRLLDRLAKVGALERVGRTRTVTYRLRPGYLGAPKWFAPEEPLAHYKVAYERDQKGLKMVAEPRLLETRFRSPQLLLWELGPEDWHLVLRLPEYAPRRRQIPAAVQLPLLSEEVAPTG
jgi:DNA-binding MarR family transcriptional regulator